MDIANGLDLCLGIDSADGNGFDLGSSSIANPFVKRWLHFQSISTVKETESDAKKYARVLFLHWNYFPLEDLIQNNALCIMYIYIYIYIYKKISEGVGVDRWVEILELYSLLIKSLCC